jgi:TFIIF-interacting CTD phosphatase-like protein
VNENSKNNNINGNLPEKQNIVGKIHKNNSVKNVKYSSKNINNVSKKKSYFNIKIESKANITNNIINNINGNSDERKEVQDLDVPFIKKELDKKFCLVLDIDETLSHMIKLPFGNYFLVRPGVMDLLKELYTYYEIDIFTAALKHYADNIINKLDKDNIYISYRLYRCHCTYEDGKSVKKLSLIGRDLNKIVFVDDLERNAKYNPQNLVLVSKWTDDVYDNEIINLKDKLKFIALSDKYDEDITKGLVDEKLTGNIK